MADEPDTDKNEKPETEESPAETTPEVDTPDTEKAVIDIEHHESDELIEAQDQQGKQSTKQRWYKKIISEKKIWIPLVVVLILVVVGAVPYTRYKVLGLFWKETYNLSVVDSQTNQPVSDAQVTLGGVEATTTSQGKASIKVGVGSRSLTISKTYYTILTEKVVVGLSPKSDEQFDLTATGRQVPIKVVDLVSGQPISNVEVSADNTSAKTNSSGQVTIVLPADKTSTSATFSGGGYNNASGTIQVTTSVVSGNTFKLTPSGTIYFLSNASGNIDVVSTNLDGTGRQTVLAGTGHETPTTTSLLASRDWKYLALNAKRDTSTTSNSLYLITASTNKLSTIDSGNVIFTPVGWSGHYFVYSVDRSPTVQLWQPGRYAIKSYNADNGTITTLYQSTAQGTSQTDFLGQYLSNVYVLNNGQVLFTTGWNASYPSTSIAGQQGSLISINPSGSDLTTIHSFPVTAGCQAGAIALSTVLYEPDSLYIQDECNQFYDYDNGQVTSDSSLNNTNFFGQPYPTFLLSPSGDQTFWGEPRDGQTTLFTGDQNAANQKQIGSLTPYTPYGWYTDNYLLVEKNGSELYIMPAGGGTALKVSDYFKPAQFFNGYGGGYGGL